MLVRVTGLYVVLQIGRPTLVDHGAPFDADSKAGWFVLRTGKGFALLFADEFERLPVDLLEEHKERRGVLVADVGDPTDEPIGDSYEDLVKELGRRGRWLSNEGAVLHDLPVPDPPRSKLLELVVVPPARAMREHALTETPKRVIRRNVSAKGTTADIVAFYRPKLEALGFTIDHDEWPNKKTEELDGLKKDARLVIGVVATSASDVFVQLLFIAR
jgi:hypothetical protein